MFSSPFVDGQVWVVDFENNTLTLTSPSFPNENLPDTE